MLRSTFFLPLTLHHNPKPILKFKLPPTISMSISTATTTTKAPQCPPPVCQNSPPTSAYIHLPFCRHRCHYCDFPIIALGSSSSSQTTSNPLISNYIHLLLREIQSTSIPNSPHPPLKTVFFGGGTPSLVPPSLVSSILSLLQSKFGIHPSAEISIEMDPGTFDRKKLEEIVGLGVNRVSLGVQAFQEDLLRVCGRAHGLREVEEAVEIVGGPGGVENWSLDLISSLPRQRQEMWMESLRRAVEAGPKHVSVYDLQVEQGTKFGQLYTPGEFPLPTETQSVDFYKIASETLAKAGYDHYEISSYSKPGYECKHNLAYWHNKPFYGFGLGSASYVNGTRFSRPRRLKEYTNYVINLEEGKIDDLSTENAEAKDAAMDVVMLSLRTARGLDVKSFAKSFGESLTLAMCKAFRPYVESGHVIAMDEAGKRFSLSEFDSKLGHSDEMVKGKIFSLSEFHSKLGHSDEMVKSEVPFMRLSDPDGFLLSNELISIAFGVISP